MWTFTVLPSFVLSFVTPDLSLFPLKDLTDRERSTGVTCRGLVKSVRGGEGRHVPGHLREAQFAIPIQVEHPQLLGTERGVWLFVLTFPAVGPCPPSPSAGGKKDGWNMLVPPLRAPGGQGPTRSPSVPGMAGTQPLLLSPLLREKATAESGPAPKAHPFGVYPLPVLRRLSQKQLLLVSVSASVSTCGAIDQHPFCQLPPRVTSPRPEESTNKKPPAKQNPTGLGSHVLRPWAGRDASVHSLWFGCTLGA